MKERILICPEFDFYLLDLENEPVELDDLKDKGGKPIVMSELDAWASEMSPVIIASETGQSYYKDWEDYHKRGLALARQLRHRLSYDYDLWYEAPFEDKSGTVPTPVKIEENYEPVVAEAGGCYIQWVTRDDVKSEELLFGIHKFDYYAEDGSTMDTYTIVPDGICFEAAGFGPGPWHLPEEDIWMRISKEQYGIWVDKIESQKKVLFALADGHTYEKDQIEVGDIIMTQAGYYKIIEAYEESLQVLAKFVYIGEYGIDYNGENEWVENPAELRRVNGGIHVEREFFEKVIDMARNFREDLINELQEYIYRGGSV